MSKDMKKGFSEQEVLELLDHLKSAGNEYPSDMIGSRREVFIKQASAMVALAGADGGNGGGSAGSIGSGLESFTLSRLLEFALVLVLAVGAGITAYLYRDAITDFIHSTLFPKTELTTVPSQDPASEPAVMPVTSGHDATETPEVIPAWTSSPTATMTVTSTPSPSLTPDAANSTNNTTGTEDVNLGSGAEVESTPTPNDGSGLHLGQTPKPERTLPPNENSPPINEDKSSKKDDSP